ncbi:hypothetical protein TWF481_010966 [Arthrobotrys musiformis]|uniref:Uncharacterized protein n=1 Tax=Arthrobotrys musiformis TaxID=47236 RepID=A0AAV9VWW9_9PEZI
MSFDRGIEEICVRWRNEPGEGVPEILVAGPEGLPGSGITDLRQPMKHLLMQRAMSSFPIHKYNDPGLGDPGYSFQKGSLRKPPAGYDICATEELMALKNALRYVYVGDRWRQDHDGPPIKRRNGCVSPANKNTYFATTATSRTESVTYNFFASEEDRHIVIPQRLPQAGLDEDLFYGRIALILAGVWGKNRRPLLPQARAAGSSAAGAARYQEASKSGLYTVTFTKLYPETEEKIIHILNREASDLKVSLRGRVAARCGTFSSSGLVIGEDGEEKIVRSTSPSCFMMLHDLKEVRFVSILLENYSLVTITRAIVAIGIIGEPGRL